MPTDRRPRDRPLPPLLPDERLLWVGAPAWQLVARHVFRVPIVTGYFVLLTLVDMAIVRIHDGPGWPVIAAARPTVLTGAACVLLLLAVAWRIGRTTTYVLTTHRVIMQFGIALPATLSIPLHRVAACSVRLRPDGSGDLALQLKERGGLSFVKLWPHVRAHVWSWWRLGLPQPMLRDLRHAGAVAPLLVRALAACDALHRIETTPAVAQAAQPIAQMFGADAPRPADLVR